MKTCKRKNRILLFPLFIDSFQGGMQRVVLDLMLKLNDLGWNCKLIGYYNSDLVQGFNKYGIECICIRKPKGFIEFIQFIYSFYKIICRAGKSIIMTNDIYTHIILSLYPFSKKEIFVSHGGDFKSKGKEYAAKSGRSARISKYTFKRVNTFVAVSDSQKEALVYNAGIKENRVKVIYNGYNNSGLQLRNNKNNIKKGVIHIAVIGYIKRLKNQIVLLKSLIDLRNRGYNCILDLYGSVVDTEYYEELKVKIVQLNLEDNVFFWGYVSDKNLIYNNTDIVISCSYHEGFGLTIIEAMAHYVPTIACAKSMGPASIITNGVTGILVKENISEQYTDAIMKYIEDPSFRAVVIENARKLFEAKFSIDVMAFKYNELLNSIL